VTGRAGGRRRPTDDDDDESTQVPIGLRRGRRAPAGRNRLIGTAVLALLVLLTWTGTPWTERQQSAWFDAHQALRPRDPGSSPVMVVAIDQPSIAELGQWPWPRTQLARLVDLIGSAAPAAIGIAILMPEPDAQSPEQIANHTRIADPALADALRRLPSNDARLARALARAPVVLAAAGTPEPTHMPLRVAPVLVRAVRDDDDRLLPPDPAVPRYAGALTSIDELDRRARGWGLLSVATSRGIIRRVPLVASIDRTLIPALAVEMLRVAQKAPAVEVAVSGTAVRRVAAGGIEVPTERDGSVRLYFAPHDGTRFVAAADVLKDRVDPKRFRGQFVLIGTTGIGLQGVEDTPIGERMSGTEIHAQLLDNLLDGNLLRRPRWASAVEAAAFAVLGLVMLWVTPRWKPVNSALLLFGFIVGALLLGFGAFVWRRWLFDAASPALGLLVLYGLLLVLTLNEVTRQRRVLQRQVQTQRVRSARLAGELQAAQQVQAATLPSAEAFAADRRIELHAALEPAREVGGDLYDFFMLDARRLFLLIGDVAGKGLSASIFMAVSKALYKSAMLRMPDADVGTIMAEANAEISRDNPQLLFVTVFAAILDLDRGILSYCNAGHDNPYRLHPSHPGLLRISDGDGPPLCAVADFAYRGAQCQLLPGELLCLMTDGVTEAQSRQGELFGQERVNALLLDLRQRGAGARELVETLRTQVKAFAGHAEPADDLTVLALRWNGPGAAA
jgi:adenylate cyclase